MRRLLLALLVFCCCAAPLQAADINFILDAKPIAIFSADDLDGFTAYETTGWSYTSVENADSIILIPNINAGIGIDTRLMRLDFTGGIGYYTTATFDGSVVRLDVAPRFRLGPVTLGPHLGFISFSEPEWSETGEVVFVDGTSGVMGGLDFSVGGQKVAFNLNLDFLAVDPIEVHGQNGWNVSQNEIDLSGGGIMMGVLFHF